MDDHPQSDRKAPSRGAKSRVDSLASSALSELARSKSRHAAPQPSPSLPDLTRIIHAAAMHPDAAAVDRAVDQAIGAGIDPVAICETCIPDVARALGDQWCVDELGFAGVTIGCARLTATLRRLEAQLPAPDELNAPHVLLLVGGDVYHTLGATVLSGMLRRGGVNVQLWVGADPDAVASHLHHSEFDALFVSASVGESLESIRRLVASAKSINTSLLTVVGGTILDSVDDPNDVIRLTGADHATKVPKEALNLCETLHLHSQTPPTRSTTPSNKDQS